MASSTSTSRRRRGLAAGAAVASVTALLIAGPVGASLRVAAEQAVQTFAFLREAESH